MEILFPVVRTKILKTGTMSVCMSVIAEFQQIWIPYTENQKLSNNGIWRPIHRRAIIKISIESSVVLVKQKAKKNLFSVWNERLSQR